MQWVTNNVLLANGLIPAVNAFQDTPVFYFIFGLVVLIESLYFWRWVRPLTFRSVLWRVVLFNAVSSFGGSILMQSEFGPGFTEVWKQAIPFYFLTLAVEFPLVCALFWQVLRSWKCALVLSATANVLSYAVLIVIERPVESVWLEHLRTLDHKVMLRWKDTRMLSEASGQIYGTESVAGLPHRLRSFDFGNQRWHSLSNCPPIDPRYWDVEGNLLAFMVYDTNGLSRRSVKMATLSDFEPVREFQLPETPYEQDSGWGVAISPDQSKLAALVPLHEIKAPLSDSSYRSLGKTCLLVVFDVTTGNKLSICPRKVSYGLCWTPDSEAVLFNSLRDSKLYEIEMLEKGWKRKYDLSNPENDFTPTSLYAYHVNVGTVEYFGVMKSVCLAVDGKRLAAKSGSDTVCILDPESNTKTNIKIGAMGYRDIEICPEGRFVLAPLTLSHPLGHLGHPTIVDLRDPSRRYYLGSSYRLDWTRTPTNQALSETTAQPLPGERSY